MILHCHFSKTPKEIKMQRTPFTRSITICWQERPSQAQKTSMDQPSTRTTPAPAAKKPLLTILYWLFTLPEKQLRKGSNACPNHPDLRSHRQTHQTQFKSTFSTHQQFFYQRLKRHCLMMPLTVACCRSHSLAFNGFGVLYELHQKSIHSSWSEDIKTSVFRLETLPCWDWIPQTPTRCSLQILRNLLINQKFRPNQAHFCFDGGAGIQIWNKNTVRFP